MFSPILTALRLRGFKCFCDEVTLPLRYLNLFTGINGRGKSSALQSLLLLHQSVETAMKRNGLMTTLELNGNLLRLGTFRELLHRDLPHDEEIDIGLEFSQSGTNEVVSYELKVGGDSETPRVAVVSEAIIEKFSDDANCLTKRSLSANINDDFPWLVCFKNFVYVSADRLGPQDFFVWANEQFDSILPKIGVRGEHAAEVLYAGRMQNCAPALQRADAETVLLPDQASSWLSYVFDGGKFKLGSHSDVILTLEMNTDGSAHYVRPIHMGFGYSYVLPIIVAGLVAKPGSMLIVENPEAHLHPMAQARIGEFLAKVAKAGVQVYVESHSEHILNAFRLAVLDEVLPAEQLSVLYFRRDEVAPVLRVPVTEKGGIEIWPEGFFDQRLHDFQRLFGV